MTVLDDAITARDKFDAVIAGTADDATCTEVAQISADLRAYAQEVNLHALALPGKRAEFFKILSPDAVTAVKSALGIKDVAAVAPVGVRAP